MDIKKLLVFFIIAMFLVTPFAGAKQEVADSVKQDKKIDEKITDKTKESAKEISNKDKDIKGKVTVTDSDSSKYTVEKKSKTEIRIAKDEAKGEHTKSKVTFAKEDLQKIDIDGDKLYGVLHIADDGSTSHDVYTESQLTSGTEMIFTENIVSGYRGYWEKTQTGVTSGTTIDIPDVSGSDYYVTYAVSGTIPAYQKFIPSDIRTWPQNTSLIEAWPLDTNANGILGRYNGVASNVSYSNNRAIFTGNSYITLSNSLQKLGVSNFTAVGKMSWNTVSGIGSMNDSGLFGSTALTPSWQLTMDSSFKMYTRDAGGITASGVVVTSADSNKPMVVIGSRIGNYTNSSIGLSRLSSVAGPIRNVNSTGSLYIGRTYNTYLRGYVDWAGIYSARLTTASKQTLYTEGSGISVRPVPSYNFTPYNVASGVEKIIDTDATCTGLEYVDTTGGTHTVTVRIYFTEDITKTTETKGAVYQNVSIIHTKQNATASVGSIAWELDPLYSGNPVLSGNNTNATVTRNDTHVIISTGLVKQGQSFSYVVSVADDHDHGIHLNQLMKWVGTGLDFVGVAPEDWDDYIGDEIEVTVS